MAVWEVTQLVVGQGTEDEFESTIRSRLPKGRSCSSSSGSRWSLVNRP
jgi:hypothetical protein